MDPIILASSSPRRQEILQRLNIPFIVHPSNIEETVPPALSPKEIPEHLACCKVNAVVRQLGLTQEIGWVLGADTAICSGGKIYGKPKNREEAFAMLKKFQGHTHEVITGLVLYNGNIHDITTRTNVNKVTFNTMSDEEIAWYISTGEWHDAAGSYRIQGFASCFIKKISGSESGVMGLPIFELYDMLREQGYRILR